MPAPKKSTTKPAVATVTEGDKDWSYLAEKDPTDLHVELAAWITKQTGVQVTPKEAQLVAILRIPFQQSEANKKRVLYRGLDEVVVAKRSEHMVEAAIEAREIIAARKAKAVVAAPKKAAPRTRKAAAPKAQAA